MQGTKLRRTDTHEKKETGRWILECISFSGVVMRKQVVGFRKNRKTGKTHPITVAIKRAVSRIVASGKQLNVHPKLSMPVHQHGVYNKPEFGLSDEHEAVDDYHELEPNLKNPESKRLLEHISHEEEDHVKKFEKIISLEQEV